jgi:heme-degrading monooxygenase HmoA
MLVGRPRLGVAPIWHREQMGELVRVWEYDVRPGRIAEFVAAYGPDGDWARLFAGADGYLGTELFRSTSSATRFVTVDRWSSAEMWAAFLTRARAAYDELDEQLSPLTLAQRELR